MEMSGELYAPAVLLHENSPPGTHWMGGWVGPKAGLDAVEKIKKSCPAGNRTLIVQVVARRGNDNEPCPE
jgi:hypothetical protein